jgi:alkaline phosphatase D
VLFRSRFENYATFPEERQRLFDEIQQNNIKGVVFLTGDRHHSELSALHRPNDYPIYDWTVSPLTSGVAKSADQDNNVYRVPGSLVQERNFGMLYFSGKKEDRQVKMVLYDTDGSSIWTKTLYLKDLK